MDLYSYEHVLDKYVFACWERRENSTYEKKKKHSNLVPRGPHVGVDPIL